MKIGIIGAGASDADWMIQLPGSGGAFWTNLALTRIIRPPASKCTITSQTP
jgi:hypothetical protein